MEYIKGDFMNDTKELIEHDKKAFDVPQKWHSSSISEAPLLNLFDVLWNELSGFYERELNVLAYNKIPASDEIKRDLGKIILLIKKNIAIK